MLRYVSFTVHIDDSNEIMVDSPDIASMANDLDCTIKRSEFNNWLEFSNLCYKD